MRSRFLFATLVCLPFALWTAAGADTWTPDHDGNGFNNSIERAIDLGQLTTTGVNIREQLGKVPWGFDSRDFYKFSLPFSFNDWELSVHLDENPSTTMWLEIYDQTGSKSIYASRGAADEDFKLPLGGGIYHIEVKTDAGTAANRNLTYTLTMRLRQVPFVERGGTACRGAPSIGSLGQPAKVLEGLFDERRQPSFYTFYVPFGFSLTGSMLGPGPSSKYMVSAINPLDEAQIPFRNSTLREEGLLLDPGFYCLKIESVGFAGLGNYRGQFVALNAGLVPGRDRNRAQKLADMELGNLTSNGQYGLVSRYVHYKNRGEIPNVSSALDVGHEYVVRDWVGLEAPTQFYLFDLPEARRLELRLYNLTAATRAFIEDAAGNLLASTTVEGVSLRDDLLAPQALNVTLPAGRKFYVRIEYVSRRDPGTPFGLWLRTLSP